MFPVRKKLFVPRRTVSQDSRPMFFSPNNLPWAIYYNNHPDTECLSTVSSACLTTPNHRANTIYLILSSNSFSCLQFKSGASRVFEGCGTEGKEGERLQARRTESMVLLNTFPCQNHQFSVADPDDVDADPDPDLDPTSEKNRPRIRIRPLKKTGSGSDHALYKIL
jgi:hypothetical protein